MIELDLTNRPDYVKGHKSLGYGESLAMVIDDSKCMEFSDDDELSPTITLSNYRDDCEEAAKDPYDDEKLHLFWVTTEDHDEDWFIVATSHREAETYHENYEGYFPYEAVAERICEIPEELSMNLDIGHPSDDVLIACGGTIVRNDLPRVVKIGKRTFAEGMLEYLIRQGDKKMLGEPNLEQKH